MPLINIDTAVEADVSGLTIRTESFDNGKGDSEQGTETFSPTLVQVAGLVPLVPCSPEDCRDGCVAFSRSDEIVELACDSANPRRGYIFMQNCSNTPFGGCYENPVFGNLINCVGQNYASYENDMNQFIVTFNEFVESTIAWTLQKNIRGTWTDLYGLQEGDLGTYNAPGYLADHLNYTGVIVNWGKVLEGYNSGCYRVKVVETVTRDTPIGTRPIPYCLVSEPFNLMAWNCDRANGTVKFETNTTGKIGDKRVDYLLHDLSGSYFYDSIRVWGFFGKEKIGEYKTINLEWGNPNPGKIEKVRDEAIQSFEFMMRQDTVGWVHQRLMVYGFMADQILVSDYNINNTDYDIKRFPVIRDSGYEPTYFVASGKRIAGVKVDFKRAVQNVIKTNC